MKKNLRIAITHDYLRAYGGAERVLLLLLKVFPSSKVFVASANFTGLGKFRKLFQNLNISTSWVQLFPVFVKHPILYRPILPLVWKSIKVGNVDIVLSSSGANIAKAVNIPKGAIHFCYCHTPPRYLYGFETETKFTKLPVIGFLVKIIISYLRVFDLKTNSNVDYFIANSRTVKDRIKKFYKRDSYLIYPSSEIINTRKSQIRKGRFKKNSYLVVSRLVSYKHIEKIIEVFNNLKFPLTVVGEGPEFARLKLLAYKNIVFKGSVDDKELSKYYRDSRALIISTPDEDFGLTSVEAQSYGCPIIAHNSGGMKESVIDGKTGVLYNNFTSDEVIKAVNKLERLEIDPFECFKNAQRFSVKMFRKKIVNYINDHKKKNASSLV